MDKVVARRAPDEGKEERLAAKGVELLGADAFLFEWRVYRELSKGRWDATEATTTEIAALRAKKQENPATAINVLSAGQMMPARERKGLEKLKALSSKSSKGTAEGLQEGFIEREKAARRGSPLQNPLVNAPSSSVNTLTQQSAGENLNVHRSLVPHFASIRSSRSCVDLIPPNMASAQGGQGGNRCLSDITIARRNIFPPQNLCRMRPGSQSGIFTLSPDPNIPPELLKVYFPEGSCMDISRDIAITMYRDLYDRICGLKPEGPEPKNKTKPSSKNSSDRKYRFSKEEGCSMDDIASSGTVIKNASQGFEDNTSFISVPEHDDGDGDVMFVNNENYAQQVDRDVQDLLSNLHAQGSSSRKPAAKTSWQTYLSSSSPVNEHQHSSQTILGIPSTSPSQCLPINQVEAQEPQSPTFNLGSVPRGTLAAAIMEFPARDSIEQFFMMEGYQEQPTTAENILYVLPGQDSGSDGDEILAEPLRGVLLNESSTKSSHGSRVLHPLARSSRWRSVDKLPGRGDLGCWSAVSEGNTADPEYVPPCGAGEEGRAGGPNSTPFALMDSFFVAESRALLFEEEYEDVAIVAASSAGGRYWGVKPPQYHKKVPPGKQMVPSGGLVLTTRPPSPVSWLISSPTTPIRPHVFSFPLSTAPNFILFSLLPTETVHKRPQNRNTKTKTLIFFVLFFEAGK
ncbi:hypothetical protein TWF569_008781 [Orbilia oligospora]|nr:hypothetical protein TWF569_008781 [Orbilia oligospora]